MQGSYTERTGKVEADHAHARVASRIAPVLRRTSVSFVVSLNLHRRHLDASQRAQVADKLTTLKKGRPLNTSKDVFTTQPQAAELLNVSLASVQRARKVRESGDKKLITAVESGEVTVTAAAKHVAAVTRYPDKAKEARPWKATPLLIVISN
jgi:hypothetical protein